MNQQPGFCYIRNQYDIGRRGCALMSSLHKAYWHRQADGRAQVSIGMHAHPKILGFHKRKIRDPPYPAQFNIWAEKGGTLKSCPRVTSEGLGEMFEGEFADKCAETFSFISIGG